VVERCHKEREPAIRWKEIKTMAHIIMEINGTKYRSKNEWDDIEEFYAAMQNVGEKEEFPDYEGDFSEGFPIRYRLEEEE